jgi:hypothetical protein
MLVYEIFFIESLMILDIDRYISNDKQNCLLLDRTVNVLCLYFLAPINDMFGV